MSSALGLNEHHNSTVINYMRFVRYQRIQQLKSIDAAFSEVKDGELGEDSTYTIDEIHEIFDKLLSLVRSDMETELINIGHTNVLLLRQLFQQAEKWHLKLQADISELENRDLLEKIADLEKDEFSGTSRDSDLNAFKSKLEPLNESGVSGLLQIKIKELEEENNTLRHKLIAAEKQAATFGQDKSRLTSELAQYGSSQSQGDDNGGNGEMQHLQAQIRQLKANPGQPTNSNLQPSEEVLTSTMKELLKTKEMLEMAEKELEKKVRQTVPFKNAMQMVQKKNEQVKELRKKLEKYEPSD